jgi:SH3 domain protein
MRAKIASAYFPGQPGVAVKTILLLVTLTFAFAGHAMAETRYVSDTLEITMRSGKGTSYGITRMLRSGTQVDVLETDKNSGYTHVRTKSGKDGWVLSRFLMKTPAARDRLATAEKKLAELEIENRKLETGMAAIKEEKDALSKNLGSLDSESRKVNQELAEIKHTASSALAIDSENKELKSRVVSLERQMQTLQQENEGLKDRTARDWFMVGAAVVLLGIIVGLIIPRIRWRKKSSWDTF